MKKAWLFLSFLISLAVFGQGVVIPDLPRRPPIQRPMPLPLQVRHLGVEVTLDDTSAVTSVDQVFYNPGPRMEEGSWIFPLPPGAHVASFTMYINGVETPAELLDAKKAAAIYGEIVRKMKDPALLEYAGGGLFKARVFPIEARSEKRIKLKYRQVVDVDEGLRRYSYPLRAAKFAADRIGAFAFSATISTNQPLKTLYSPTHSFHTVRDGDRKASMSFEASRYTPGGDVEILYAPDGGDLGMQALAHASGKDRIFWLSITPDMRTRKVSPKNLCLVIDTSGSMSGEKMAEAKKALSFCVRNLNAKDRFEIVRFSTEAESFAGKWLVANKANKENALQFIDQMQAIGGTNMEDALKAALALPQDRERPSMVALITDGKPTIGTRDETRLVEMTAKEQTSQRIFTFGIGQEINVHLLDKLADKTGGWRTYAAPGEDIEIKLSSFYRKIQSPVLTNLKLTVSGVKVKSLHPHSLPDLFLGLPLNLFGAYEGSGNGEIVLEGNLAGERKRFVHRFRFPKKEGDNGFIPQLWAQRRVGFLLDQIRLHGEDHELVDEVKALASKYGVVTPYTSYLILEDEPLAESPRPVFLRQSAPERDELRVRYKAMKQKDGHAGVSASESIQTLTMADSLAEPVEEEKAASPKKEQSQVRQVCGRAFYLVDSLWRDALLDSGASQDKQRITFASDAYFQLLKDHPELGPVLALGPRVEFVHQGTTYMVHND